MPKPMGAVAKPKNLKKSLKRFFTMLKPWAVPTIIALLLATASTICGIFGPKSSGI